MFTKQKLPEDNIFQIQSFPLFQKVADCHFFSFRKIQRHFDVSIFPFFSLPTSSTRLVLSPHRVSLPDLGVIRATMGCAGTAERREQNGQPFSLGHITPSPACMGSWAHPPVWPPFQTFYIYLRVFESLKANTLIQGNFQVSHWCHLLGLYCNDQGVTGASYTESFLWRSQAS